MDKFSCTAISCARLIQKGRTRYSYLIEETCRHSQSGACTYKRSHIQTPVLVMEAFKKERVYSKALVEALITIAEGKNEVKRSEPQAQESVRTA